MHKVTPLRSGQQSVRTSQLSLVDLAGSERQPKLHMQEGWAVNKLGKHTSVGSLDAWGVHHGGGLSRQSSANSSVSASLNSSFNDLNSTINSTPPSTPRSPRRADARELVRPPMSRAKSHFSPEHGPHHGHTTHPHALKRRDTHHGHHGSPHHESHYSVNLGYDPGTAPIVADAHPTGGMPIQQAHMPIHTLT